MFLRALEDLRCCTRVGLDRHAVLRAVAEYYCTTGYTWMRAVEGNAEDHHRMAVGATVARHIAVIEGLINVSPILIELILRYFVEHYVRYCPCGTGLCP